MAKAVLVLPVPETALKTTKLAAKSTFANAMIDLLCYGYHLCILVYQGTVAKAENEESRYMNYE